MASNISTTPCLIHGTRMRWQTCPQCDAYKRAVDKGLAHPDGVGYSSSRQEERASTAKSPKQGEQTTMATPSNITARANALIEGLELTTVPALAERMGVSKAALYAALKQDREGIEPTDTSVLEAIAALEEEVGIETEEAEEETEAEGDEEWGPDDEGDNEAGYEEGEEEEEEGEDEAEEEEEAEEVAPPAPKAKKAPKAAAKAAPKAAPAKKAAAKPAKAVKGSKTKEKAPSKQDLKVLQLPKAGETLATTSAKVLVVEEDGSESNRTVGPVTKTDTGYAARVRLRNRIFEVTSKDGKRWTVTGARQSKLEREAAAKKAKPAPKAAPAKKATAKPAATSTVKAAPKPSASKKAKGSK